MRVVLEATLDHDQANVGIRDLTAGLLADGDWAVPSNADITTEVITSRFFAPRDLCATRERFLPLRPDDPVLDEILPNSEYPESDPRRAAIRNALVILCQIPLSERDRAVSSHMIPIYQSGADVHGILFTREDSRRTITIRIRQNDQQRLRTAALLLAGSLASRRDLSSIRVISVRDGVYVLSESASGRLATQVTRLEMISAFGEPVERGEVIELNSFTDRAHYVLFSGAPLLLFSAGCGLTLVSAILFFPPWGTQPLAEFAEGLVGRLATGFFSAQLVTAAERWNVVRALLRGRGTKSQHGAIIRWSSW